MKRTFLHTSLAMASSLTVACTLTTLAQSQQYEKAVPFAQMETGSPIVPIAPEAEVLLLQQLRVQEIHSVRFRTEQGVFILRGSKFEGDDSEGIILEGPIDIGPAATIEEFSAGSTFLATGSPGCEWEWHDGRWVLVKGQASNCNL